MKKLMFLALCSFSFAVEVDNIYEEAQALENQGKYKEAMLLYKKVANLKVSKEDKYVNDLNEKQNSEFGSFTTLKREFYQKEIDKTEDKSTNENIKQIVTKDFDIYPYKKNYLLPATYTFNNIENRENIETTFQVSFEKPIYNNLFGFDETISAAYTQKSFWQVAKNSAPFRESNYEPEIFVQIPYDKESSLKAYKISAMHSSNGKDGEESRSLNRLYLEGYFQFSDIFVIPRVWYRIPESKDKDDNPDFEDYYGYGDLTLLYAYKQHTFELLLRDNLKFNENNKGAVEFTWTFPLPEFLHAKNVYGMFQYFYGYGNSLIDYDREINNVGLGIALSR
ncbi:phospholipase A [Aliarcobacter butzleri]|uniref:phospholipase A n=1 Tax=Aliarcobacter butzleri TaxID=28197 RepID=UPI001EDC1599|nr:phospholipase A [Aliarcobacter butzleri]MCG3677020.1 phospholipase A [Aliarcobacter butzleri]